MTIVNRAFMVMLEIDCSADTSIEDIAVMVDCAFDAYHPADPQDHSEGCTVYEIAERRP